MAQAQAEIKLIERHVTVLTITKIIVTLQQHDRHNDQQLDGWLAGVDAGQKERARSVYCMQQEAEDDEETGKANSIPFNKDRRPSRCALRGGCCCRSCLALK